MHVVPNSCIKFEMILGKEILKYAEVTITLNSIKIKKLGGYRDKVNAKNTR